MVKLGLVHFLANFAFGTIPETKVSNFFWNIVDSADANIKQFPYGKHLWEKSRHSMRLSLMKKEETFEKMFDEKTGKLQPYSYKLFGFPYAFFIWIFETIPALSLTFCEKLEVVQLLPKKSEKEIPKAKQKSPDKTEHSLSSHGVVPRNYQELEGKKLKGALIRDDHDCTDEVVDAAYSGFIAAMKFIQKSKREGTQGIIPFHEEIEKNAPTKEIHAYNDLNKFMADANDVDFHFGIMHIKKKYWFYQLQTCGQFLSDSHIDIIMYYLRKTIMHNGTINVLVTTTDSIFYKVVRTTYESYLANDNNVINQESIIAKYMSGQSLSCSIPRYYLDHVAIPAHVTDEVHYILAHFNIRERCLVLYNSITLKVNKEPVDKTVTTFSVLIPLFMECIGFYNTRADIDFNQGPYAVARSNPLAIKFAKGVPQQEDW
ncbi:hypothetical protein F8388_023142 [Cannabis sativa]|uniref:Ubiquitin-like protease family profile domain-containing protein n=1 Tax=Cannabis sativa TaxID=3483 RepID=A0A7J6HN65_CANSA|nr:hypothetical protein F8388_023142 [Cannabis sativa]KAF4396706.1 hypothetical protein G4B88_029020 [Cannabis sativa]